MVVPFHNHLHFSETMKRENCLLACDYRVGAVVRAGAFHQRVPVSIPGPGARFSKAPESFRARKAIFRSSVSKNGEVYTLETSCMKGASLHL